MRLKNKLGCNKLRKGDLDTSYLEKTAELSQNLSEKDPVDVSSLSSGDKRGVSNLEMGATSTTISKGLSHTLANAGFGALVGAIGGFGGMAGGGMMPGGGYSGGMMPGPMPGGMMPGAMPRMMPPMGPRVMGPMVGR